MARLNNWQKMELISLASEKLEYLIDQVFHIKRE